MPQGTPQISPLVNMIPLILLFVIFYFMLIRPQKSKEREHQKMVSSIAKNDEVITSGGIHGTVVNVKEKSVILRVDDNVKIEMEKSCIAYVKKSQSEEAKKG